MLVVVAGEDDELLARHGVDIKNLGGKDVAVIVDLLNLHTKGEGRDVQHVQESSFGRSDSGSSSNDLNVSDDFNSTTSNLGGDTESLEERGLAGFHTSVSGRDVDVEGSDGTSTSRGGDTVGENLLTGLLEITVGEDETDVACQ